MAAPPALGEGEECLAGLPYRLVGGERRVARHEEVQPGGGDQRGNQPDEVIVHVPGIPERGGAGRHDGGDLGERMGSALMEHVQNLLHTALPGPVEAAPRKGRGPSFTAPSWPSSSPAHGAGSDQIKDSGEAP